MNELSGELSFEKRLFNFNKYLKKFEKDKACYFLDHKAIEFFEKYCDMSTLEVSKEGDYYIDKKQWRTMYLEFMKPVKDWMSEYEAYILEQLNAGSLQELKAKYAVGGKLH